MKAIEFLSENSGLSEANKDSKATRYNSELGLLHVFAGAGPFDPNDIESSFDKGKLDNPDKTIEEIQRLLADNYKPNIVDTWLKVGPRYAAAIKAHSGVLPTKFGWAGGDNAGGVADVEFIGHPTSGISVKEKSGITLSNLSPAAVGLKVEKSIDVFEKYASEQYIQMKTKIFNDVLNQAQAQPDVPFSAGGRPEFSVTYNPESDNFTIMAKKAKYVATRNEIMSKIKTNAAWQRVFGNWYQENWATKKHYSTDLFTSIAQQFELIIEKALRDRPALDRVLQIEEQPYYYATPKNLYFVPARKDTDDLQVKGLKYAKPDGTGQKFQVQIGYPDSKENCKILVYIRYANGLFQSNPTVRVQEIKDPEFLGWEKLI